MVKKKINTEKVVEETKVVEEAKATEKVEEIKQIPRMVVVGKDNVGNPIWKPSTTEFIREE